jgi:hypothetical protein
MHQNAHLDPKFLFILKRFRIVDLEIWYLIPLLVYCTFVGGNFFLCVSVDVYCVWEYVLKIAIIQHVQGGFVNVTN